MIEAGHPVYGFANDAYWLDLGTPEKYLQAHFDMIEGKVHDVTYASPWVAEGADVDLRAHLGPLGGGRARARASARAPRSTTRCCTRARVVAADAKVLGSVLAPDAAVGEGATVTDSVLGEGASVPAGASLEGARVPAGAEAEVV